MSLYSQLDRLASDLEAVKAQLHAVANTNQLQRSSVEAGSLDFNDEDGNLKAIIGLQHDGATTVNIVNGPKPATPAGITAGVDNGRIILRWDGTFAGDLIAPTDWARTEIYAQEGSFVVPTPANARGSFVSAAGGELTIGVKRGTWTVCVAAWSQAGRQSEMSVPITVEVPGFGDLVQEAIDQAEALIEEARTTLEAGQAELTEKLGSLTTDLGDLGYDIDLVQLAQTQLTEDVTAAQAKADSAFQTSADAESKAATAQGVADAAAAAAASAAGIANGKATVLYQTTAPAAEYRNAQTLWIDTTGGANTPKRWTTGTTWVAVTDKAATDAAAAASAAQTKATDAKTAADAAKTAADAAQATATAAGTAADAAQQRADQAKTAADTAQATATDAGSAAAAAAGIADGKATVLYQTTAPAAEYRKPTTLWIDTTGGANTPKRWTTGTTWVAVTDKAATDAAAAAAAAKSAADSAKAVADKAVADAAAAQATATQALTSANSKNTITRSTSNPPASYTGRLDDVWWKMTSMGAGGRVLSQSRWTGTAWLEEQIDSAVLAYVDAAKITTGFLDVATLIRAAAITVDKLLIGSYDNFIPNGDLSLGNATGWATGFTYQNTDTPPSFTGAVNITGTTTRNLGFGLYPVEPGDNLQFEMWVKADKAGSRLVLECRDQANAHLGRSGFQWANVEGPSHVNGTYPAYVTVPTAWTKIVRRIKVPTNVTSIKLGSFIPNHSSGTDRTATISVSGMKLYRQNGATLIEPGGIQTPQLAADVLEVKNLKAGSGQLNEAVITKLFSDVVVARMAQAQEFIGENAILTDSITAPKIVASEELTAKIAEFLRVRAEMVEADAIDGMVITGTVVQTAKTGPRSLMDLNGFSSIDETEDVRVRLGPNEAFVKGTFEAETLVAQGDAEFRSTGNSIASGGKLTLAAGVTNPTQTPKVTPFRDQFVFSPVVETSIKNLNMCAPAWDGTYWWTYTRELVSSEPDGQGGTTRTYRNRVQKIHGTTMEVTTVSDLSATGSVREMYGVTCLGSELFWLMLYNRFDAKVVVTDLNFVKKREWDYTEYLGYDRNNPLGFKPGIGHDGTNIVIAQCNDSGFLNIRTFNKTTGALISRVYDPNDGTASDIGGVYVGTADWGTKVATVNKLRTGGFPSFNPTTGVYMPTTSAAPMFYGLAGQLDTGLVWKDDRFHSLNSGGIITQYAQKELGDGGTDWWAGYSWATDADNNGSAEIESMMSPPKQFTWPYRSKIKVTAPPLPATVGYVQPALAKKSSKPTRTDFHVCAFTVSMTKPEAWYNKLASNWASAASPSAVNQYPTATPAILESASATLQFKGDGSGRWGPLTVNAAGQITSGLPRTATGGGVEFPTVAATNGSQTVSITFPSGRFTDVPSVSAMTSQGRVTPVVFNITKTGFTFRVWNFTTGSAPSVVGTWLAVQEA